MVLHCKTGVCPIFMFFAIPLLFRCVVCSGPWDVCRENSLPSGSEWEHSYFAVHLCQLYWHWKSLLQLAIQWQRHYAKGKNLARDSKISVCFFSNLCSRQQFWDDWYLADPIRSVSQWYLQRGWCQMWLYSGSVWSLWGKTIIITSPSCCWTSPLRMGDSTRVLDAIPKSTTRTIVPSSTS